MSTDAARYNRLLLDGMLPFQFTYRQVVSEPDVVAATIVAALRPFLDGVSRSA